jgi:hypothetical protein
MTAFPTSLPGLTTSHANGQLIDASDINTPNGEVNALAAKVGIDSSAVTTSHDYKLSGVTGTDKAASKTGAETLTNKTLTTPTIADFTNAAHNHSNAAGGGTVSHTSLSNIGTNTHAQIDTHIAASIAHGTAGSVVGTSDSQALTNKTISGASNTLTVREADLSLTDITTANASTTKHGLLPKLPNDATKFLDGTGAYSAVSGGDKVVFVRPGEGFMSNASLVSYTNAISLVSFTDGGTGVWQPMVKVPTSCTSISSIKVWFAREVNAVVRLTFASSHIDTDSAGTAYEQDNTDTETSYTSSSADGNFESFTVPPGAYNGLTNIDADDIVGLRIERNGSSVSDTYNAAWKVLGVLFTFA